MYVEDAGWFTVFSVGSRFLLGFGNGCLNCSSSSIITTNYRHNMSSLIGLTQSFVGIGMLCGPIMGSLLYEIGGFVLPFLVTGGILLFMAIPIAFFLPQTQQKVINFRGDDENQDDSFSDTLRV